MESALPPPPAMRWIAGGALLLAAAYLFFRSEVYRPPVSVNLAAMHLQTLSGPPLPGALVQNRPVVLNFWAPWCGPCRVETPWLQHLQASHPQVTVLGVEDDPLVVLDALQFAKTAGITYPLALTNAPLQQSLGTFTGLPTTLYLSRSGRVVHTATGVVPESVMQSYLQDAVAAE